MSKRKYEKKRKRQRQENVLFVAAAVIVIVGAHSLCGLLRFFLQRLHLCSPTLQSIQTLQFTATRAFRIYINRYAEEAFLLNKNTRKKKKSRTNPLSSTYFCHYYILVHLHAGAASLVCQHGARHAIFPYLRAMAVGERQRETK